MNHSKPSRPVKPNTANRVRIIGGIWRSRTITFAEADGLRPTANRVRETLFNWLGQMLHDRRVLDLFSGSGALGFEAASRGATKVVMVENNRTAIAVLSRNRENFDAKNCQIVKSGACEFLARNRELFDVVFLDPPFGSDLMLPTLATLPPHLAPAAFVYVEWGAPIDELVSASSIKWQVLKQARAGVVHFALLTLGNTAT